MSPLQTVAPVLAVLSSLALAAMALARRPRGRLHWGFALGMVAFAADALIALVLLTGTEAPEDRLFWLRAGQVAGLLLLVPWGLFVAGLAHPEGTRLPLPWRLGLAAGAALALGGSAAVAALPAFEVGDIPGPFYAALLEPVGRYGVILQLLATVGILTGLEASLRVSRGFDRWRIKYLLLGLGAIFLARFYLLGHLLLFHVLMAVYPAIGAATLVVGNLLVGAGLARQRLGGINLALSRSVLYRSVVGGVLGLYLFAVGALGWLLNRLGIPEEMLWGSVVVFVSALGLAVILLSENVRWRIKRFIGVNFYRSKYDYRAQWGTFTKRLGSPVTVEELTPRLLEAVCAAVGALKGALYLADERGSRFYLAGAIGISPPVGTLQAASPLLAALEQGQNGEPTSPLAGPHAAAVLGDAAVAVPLRWRGALTGIMLIGPEQTGAPYAAEDLEFLATVGEQAAGAIATARLSESLAQSREFEAFHRLTSFVIHDLKNSISALSMLSQNALEHFDDPEFRRDALKTLARTVDRMKALLTRLAARREASARDFQPVDLATLALEALFPVAGHRTVNLVKDLGPVPPVAGDPEALLRVIQNLVTNAVQALDGGGTVTVRTYEERAWAVLSVADTGCGMTEEFIRKSLFVPFCSTKRGGWGIGLSQAKGIVESHGGTLEVASQEGEGTTFWMRLPLDGDGRRLGREEETHESAQTADRGR